VSCGIEAFRPVREGGAGGDARRNTRPDQRIAVSAGIMTPVCKQCPRANVAGGLPRRQEHPDRTALCIRQDAQFRVQTAPCPPDQPSATPFEPPGSMRFDAPGRGSRRSLRSRSSALRQPVRSRSWRTRPPCATWSSVASTSSGTPVDLLPVTTKPQ